MQLLLQIVAQAWYERLFFESLVKFSLPNRPEQLMSALADDATAFSELKSLALGALLAHPKVALFWGAVCILRLTEIQMGSRGSTVWLQQYLRHRVRSEAHLLALSRVKQFADIKLSVGKCGEGVENIVSVRYFFFFFSQSAFTRCQKAATWLLLRRTCLLIPRSLLRFQTRK